MAITGKKISALETADIAAFKTLFSITDLPITLNNWYGKKIAWFGTSVPNSGLPTTYPKLVGDNLKCTVVNKAISGSVVRKGAVGETQYGFASDEDVDSIPEGMEVYGFRSLLDNGGSSLWDSDLFVFDHGHNDHGLMDSYKVGGVLTLTEGNSFDRDWMVGGLNYVIAEILKANVHARFAIINEYRWGDFDNKDANQLVADYWGIPILNWELGVKNVNPNSLLDDTILKYYTGTELHGDTDYIHPGTTLRPIMAKKLASWLMTVV